MPHSLIQIKDLHKSYGSSHILKHLSLDVYRGEFLTLLGPSGCGKTTLLRLISGFEHPSSGEIFINGTCVNDFPPQQRNVHTVFQSYALFPHLSVFENVAFALRCRGVSEIEIHSSVEEALSLVQLQAFGNRRITQLSGGQQQRVAIARAVINRPQVLLLDEPLSSLDYNLRKTMQYELKQLQKTLNMTFIFVTHDQEEALSMSDRIVVMHQGTIEQIGTPRTIYEDPCNLSVAKFIGETNCFDVTVLHVGKYIKVEVESVPIQCKKLPDIKRGDRYHLIIRPEDVRVWSQSEVKNTKHMLPGTIIDTVYKGSTVALKVVLKSGTVISAIEFFNEDDDKLEYQDQESVWVEWLTGWELLLPYED
ncbi:MAG: spermidine/putrescine ABC transporter ATP-binding protein PotA [Gammaproteobacteria bacterium]|nr:spermidine/putrescine ABC transporter ATP-binding protein PotA [Gammaproteobacteria bacterium]